MTPRGGGSHIRRLTDDQFRHVFQNYMRPGRRYWLACQKTGMSRADLKLNFQRLGLIPAKRPAETKPARKKHCMAWDPQVDWRFSLLVDAVVQRHLPLDTVFRAVGRE